MDENRALIPDPVAMYAQTESKEVKDLSKNLVSGDFERQYREGMMEKPRRRPVTAILAVLVAAVVVWLLVLTLVREVQISRLRHEVDELTANVLALSANVKNLNQKVAVSSMFEGDVREIGDTIYADTDDGPDEWTSKKTEKTQDRSLEKLHDVTVTELESDSDLVDDEDDDDYEESGDWYLDYDKRREKVGTSSMVRLKPEDFMDSVVMVNKEKEGLSNNILELKRILNENPENPDIAFPPLPTAATGDRSKRSVFTDDTSMHAPYPTPHTLSKTEERRKTKKFLANVDAPPNKQASALQTVSRTVRSDNEGTRRPFIAAHFHGNTSHLSSEIHEHYKGNGLLRVAHGAPHDVWYPSQWTASSPHPRPTLTRNGHIHVHHTGVYLVYVQIYYLDSHDVISWVLHRTNSEIDGRETILQCAQSSHSSEPMDKPNSCFSSSALFLKAGDRLAVRNTGGDRHALMQPEKSFIGLIKLADADDPNEEF